jgi:hypothetical protein
VSGKKAHLKNKVPEKKANLKDTVRLEKKMQVEKKKSAQWAWEKKCTCWDVITIFTCPIANPKDAYARDETVTGRELFYLFIYTLGSKAIYSHLAVRTTMHFCYIIISLRT